MIGVMWDLGVDDDGGWCVVQNLPYSVFRKFWNSAWRIPSDNMQWFNTTIIVNTLYYIWIIASYHNLFLLYKWRMLVKLATLIRCRYKVVFIERIIKGTYIHTYPHPLKLSYLHINMHTQPTWWWPIKYHNWSIVILNCRKTCYRILLFYGWGRISTKT